MKAEIVNVTPQMAADWLQANTENRPLRRTVVNGLKESLSRGEYIPTHQGIAFSEDGTLLDGQHRLTAISELRDGLFPMLVTWGVAKDAFKVMDIGVKRTAADALKEERRLVEVARLIAVMLDTSKGSVTPTMLIPIIDRICGYHEDLVCFAPRQVKTWSSAPVRAAAVVSMMMGIDRDYVKLVYRSLVNSEFSLMPKIAQALVKAHNNGTVRAAAVADMFARAMTVFNPEKADVERILIKDPYRSVEIVRAIFSHVLAAKKKAAPEGAAKSASVVNYNRAKRRAA